MDIKRFDTKLALSQAAATRAADILRKNIRERGRVAFIAAAGNSALDFWASLVQEEGVDWSKATMFQLDEYIGLDPGHRAVLSSYLQERVIEPTGIENTVLVRPDAPDPVAECARLNEIIANYEIDLACVGIGENGHLAFNDPPADFETDQPYLVVELDEVCRRQQYGEGWFDSLEAVPRRAITMSIPQIMEAREVICVVPAARKAQAVRDCFTGEVTPDHPASILRRHDRATVYLDAQSAALLDAVEGVGTSGN